MTKQKGVSYFETDGVKLVCTDVTRLSHIRLFLLSMSFSQKTFNIKVGLGKKGGESQQMIRKKEKEVDRRFAKTK